MRTRGRTAVYPVFSEEDRDLEQFKWINKTGYAYTWNSGKCSRKTLCVFAHHIVLERVLGRVLLEGEWPDHINRNKLDNRRENLRVVTRKQSTENRRCWGASGYRGASFLPDRNKWRARVRHNGRAINLGEFDTAAEAGRVAATKRKELGFNGE